jgi:hypothetical protein
VHETRKRSVMPVHARLQRRTAVNYVKHEPEVVKKPVMT